MEKYHIWTDHYQMRTYEADFNNKLKIESFTNYIQESAARHANYRKVGYHDLIKKNCVWMLSRLKIQIKKYPEIGDTLKLETWVDGRDRLFSHRDFHFYIDENEIIAAARTSWLILDLERKRLRSADEFVEDFPAIPGRCNLKEPNQKIDEFEAPEPVGSYMIQRSDLDILQHTNNVTYIKFLFNTLGNRLNNNEIENFEINFIAESKLNDVLNISFLEYQENQFLAKIFNDKDLVRSKFELRNMQI